MVSNMPAISKRTNPPRTLYVRFPRGETIGPAHRPDLQGLTVRAALGLLESATEPGTAAELPPP